MNGQSSNSSDFKKGFFVGLGVAVALVAVSFGAGVIRKV
jgi:hypothetical protein